MTQVKLKHVSGSSMIARDGYDEATQALAVEFHNGQVYEYRGVDPGTFRSYDSAESKGKYLHRHIKPNISGVPV